MKIVEYSSDSCVKCKVLDRTLKNMTLPTSVLRYTVEEEGNEAFESRGITTLPTLQITDDSDNVITSLSGIMTPKQIMEAITNAQ